MMRPSICQESDPVLEHVAIAVLIQIIVVLAFRSWGSGAAAACVWSVSCEITQTVYRWIEHLGGELRANMPWWGGLDLRVWQSLDSWLDWIVPCFVGALSSGQRQSPGD
jgi:hypothetical protein